MTILRPYQIAARAAVFGAWSRGIKRPAVVHATGVGKTTTFTAVIDEWLRGNSRSRVLVGAHRKELIHQPAKRLSADLGRAVGIVMGTLNQTLPQVICASVPTLRSERRRRMIRDVGLIVVDECHHAAAASYGAMLDHWPGADVLGVTATMSRGDNLSLGKVWQEVVHEYLVGEAVADGWLVRPHGIAVRVEDLDLRKVKTKAGGDYADGALGKAIEGSLAPRRIVEAYREHAAERQGVVFLPTVHSAEIMRDEFRAAGFATELVHGETPTAERVRIIQGIRDGRVQVVTNCGVFTEGTDLPMLSCIVIARPTNSNGLYIQMAGRGFRLWCPVHNDPVVNLHTPCCNLRKIDALVLDIVGATRKHTLSARVELFGPEEARKIEDVERELSDDSEDDPAEDLVIVGSDIEPVDYLDGELVYDPVDLFGKSDQSWAKTRAGIWFLETDTRYLAVLPGPECAFRPDYDVVSMDRYQSGQSVWIERRCDGLPRAMRAAELDLTVKEKRATDRTRAWRRNPPGSKQVELMQRLGLGALAHHPDMTAGAAGEYISVAMASFRIDPYLPDYVLASRV